MSEERKDISGELSFSCPSCENGELDRRSSDDTVLRCNTCSVDFPIINDIPRIGFFESVNDSFGYQWNIFRQTQLDSFSRLPISRDRIYELTGWKQDINLKGESILEAGSGSGRFTEILAATQANLFTFDYSEAIDANRKNNSNYKNVRFFQSDIFNIPFGDNQFDHVFCVGVIQHTPNPKLAFESLVSKVKPGGKIYIDSYRKDFFTVIHWKYVLRPITKRLAFTNLFPFIQFVTPRLIPIARILRKILGRAGARLVPIVEYSHLGLSKELNRKWSILDTFDMYSPAHDHPASIRAVKIWFREQGLKNVIVKKGDNGIIATGQKPI